MYKGYVSRSIAARHLVMPHVLHMHVLLYIVMPHIRYLHFCLHIGVRLEGRTTFIWSFGCGFACSTAMGCGRFKLSIGVTIVLYFLIVIK